MSEMLVTVILLLLHDNPLLVRVLLVPHAKDAATFEYVGGWREIEHSLTLFRDHAHDPLTAQERLEQLQPVTLQIEEEPQIVNSVMFRKLPRL